jgi:hypothetical protein
VVGAEVAAKGEVLLRLFAGRVKFFV